MSRNKKSRKPGSTSEVEVVVTRNRTQSDVDGRLRKRLKKRKGQKSGSRHSASEENQAHRQNMKKDPRIGSKKKIPLIVEAKKKPNKQQRRVSAEEELQQLETDAQLNVLLDRLENGESLGVGLQSYVDEKLDRMEALMKQLGIYDDVEDETTDTLEEVPEYIEPKPVKTKKVASSDDDLLEQFENLDLGDFKG
jgi:ribosome assembly protein YihI (activator of Der GTPase)